MNFVYSDGGRKIAGFKGTARDCVVRAISIALGVDYLVAYKQIAATNKDFGFAKSARNGVHPNVYEFVLKKHGFVWHSAPKFVGRKARCSDLPKGRVIARQSHHLVAVVDGVPHDVFDSSGKMVYGYFAKK